jgi:superoxide reductase
MFDLEYVSVFRQNKHLPVIQAPDRVKKGKYFNFKVVVNKETPLPERELPQRFWFTVYFLPRESGTPYQVVQPLFSAQKEAWKTKDSFENPVLYQASFKFKTEKAGTIYAAAYCPLHGLSQSGSPIEIT